MKSFTDKLKGMNLTELNSQIISQIEKARTTQRDLETMENIYDQRTLTEGDRRNFSARMREHRAKWMEDKGVAR
jgi:hypothetical protein